MGKLVTTLAATFACTFLLSDNTLPSEPSFDKRHILYLMSTNKVEDAISQYIRYYKQTKKHDLKILEQLGNILIDKGANSPDLEDQLITLFGIGISGCKSSLHFLESAMKSRFPAVQAAAINLLGQIHEDIADDIIALGLKSDYIMIRVEALHHLISRKAKNAIGQVEGLCNLLHPQFKSYFVEFYAFYGSTDSIRSLKGMINDQDINVRIAAIISSANYMRDDLLPNIRSALTHSDPALKEAAAYALGALRDLNSVEGLKLASLTPFAETKLSALFSLYKLGDQEARIKILELVEEGNPFAIQLAGQIDNSESALRKLLTNPDSIIRLNAAISMLTKRDPLVSSILMDILNIDSEAIGFVPYVSPGRVLVAWKPFSPASLPTDDLKRNLQAITQGFQEEILRRSVDLPESAFLDMARKIFQSKHNSLVPLLVRLLENVQTEGARNLLREYAGQLGSPLVRGYCNLGLYRLGEGEEHRKHFMKWLATQKGVQLIEFKPMMDRGAREDKNVSNYQLSPEEKSGLLIECFDSIALKHDIEGIELILEAIRSGHEKNRYAFAGLLLKSIH